MQILTGGQQVPGDMTAEQGIHHEGDAICYQEPGKEKMPTPGQGKPSITWYCYPNRKSLIFHISIRTPGSPKESGGVYFITKDAGSADKVTFLVLHAAYFNQRRLFAIR